jgi:hypothetical protein
MNPYLYLGVAFATVALLFYSLFYWRNRKRELVTRGGCLLQMTGLDFDIAGTVLMIVGSKNIPLTVHGIIGYSALLAMLVKTAITWRQGLRGEKRSAGAKAFGSVAYFWWILAYLAGGMIAMLEVRG